MPANPNTTDGGESPVVAPEEHSMKRLFLFALTLALVSSWAAASPSDHGEKGREHRPQRLLAFGTMYGVDGPFLGSANEIRDVEGDDLPWVVQSARGSLD